MSTSVELDFRRHGSGGAPVARLQKNHFWSALKTLYLVKKGYVSRKGKTTSIWNGGNTYKKPSKILSRCALCFC